MSDPEPTSTEGRRVIAVMSRPECVDLLTNTPIGRVVFIDDGHPIALPANYRWHEDYIVFRAQEGTTLHDAVVDTSVSFEVDRWDEHSQTGTSVVVKGAATEVVDWAEKALLEDLGIVPWADGKWRQSWIRITPSEITGRQIN